MGPVNSYLVEETPLTLIDCGLRDDGSWSSLTEGLRTLGYGVGDLELLLNTHAHLDHYGQMARVQAECGAPLWAHEAAAVDLVRSGPEDPGSQREAARAEAFYRANGVPDDILSVMHGGVSLFESLRDPVQPARLLREGDRVEFATGELQVIHTPGHTPGHICFFDPAARCLVSGDHLLPDITPVPLLHFPADPAEPKPRSLCDYVASVRKLFPYGLRRAVGGHGLAMTNLPALYESYGLHQKMRTHKILRFLQRTGTQMAYAVCQYLFPKISTFEVFLGMSEAVGHLELLEEDGRVVARQNGDHVQYTAVV